MAMLKWLIKVVILTLLPTLLFAQSPGEEYLHEPLNQNQLDRTQWEKTVNGLDYTSSRKKVQKKDANERNYPRERQLPSLSFGGGIWAILAKIILIVGGIILIAFLLKYLLGYEGFRSKKSIKTNEVINGEIDLEQIEENIHETDLERYIRQALESKQYALAIRLYYLHILKDLSQLQHIKWKKDKTNRAYLDEMNSSPYNQSFRQLTLIFERVWYGANELNEADFKQLEPQFKIFLEQINPS